jgi:uncharacterized protein YdeI (YjbR/CyaY-like superfamily)
MQPTTNVQPEQFYPENREAWRAWLAEHHATAPGVWLIYYKKHTGMPTVTYDEAVEEALCFGWIDSRPNTLGDDRYMQLFSPRKPKSPWSKVNKERIARLTAEGRMAPAGLAMIEAAQADGSWSSYDGIEALEIPDDLEAALAANPIAEGHFARFNASAKKQLLRHIASAKRPETRAKRVAQIVAAAAENRNPLAYTRKGDE